MVQNQQKTMQDNILRQLLKAWQDVYHPSATDRTDFQARWRLAEEGIECVSHGLTAAGRKCWQRAGDKLEAEGLVQRIDWGRWRLAPEGERIASQLCGIPTVDSPKVRAALLALPEIPKPDHLAVALRHKLAEHVPIGGGGCRFQITGKGQAYLEGQS